MENFSIVLIILAVVICLSAVADRVRIPYPILLIIAGIVVGFIRAGIEPAMAGQAFKDRSIRRRTYA